MMWWDPFDILGTAAQKLVADAWTVAMMSVWGAGLYLTRILMGIVDWFTNPDLSADGPAKVMYQYTFGIALLLAMVLLVLQLGRAVLRRDGRSLGQALWGAVQFQGAGLLWVLWCVLVFGGASGLAATFRQTLLGVDTWSAFQPFTPLEAEDVSDGVVAAVLGVMGLLMVVAALMHFIVLLVAATSALVIAVTGIIAAAGLVNESTSRWFWMTLRWFHAAAFTPVVVVLMLGLSIQISQGVILEDGDSMSQDISTALIGIVLICISVFSPLALFKLLAFVDPGTNSGAALRTAMQSTNTQRSSGSDAASRVDSQGRSAGERAGEAETAAKIGQAQAGSSGGAAAGGGTATGGRLAAAGGALGVAAGAAGALLAGGAAVLGGMRAVGAQGAVVGADIANQGGIGHNTYVPDYRDAPRRQQQGQPEVNNAESGAGGSGGGGLDHQVPHLNTPPTPTPPAGGGGGVPSGGPSVPAGGGASVPAPPAP